jgi:hypothetical protein
VRLTFLAGDGGLVPEGQDITYILTARTSDGYYRQDSQVQHFGTTYIDEYGNIVDPAVISSASVQESPVRSILLMFPGSNICQLKISVQNPLETPLTLNVGQDLPLGTAIVDPGGATIGNNHLGWEVDLPAGQATFYQVVLELPSPVGSLPLTSTTAAAYDAINAVWIQFSQAPVISHMLLAPPPQVQHAGFNDGSFELRLQLLIPGVYRVEATSDFGLWDPVVTVTNTAGSFEVADPSAQPSCALLPCVEALRFSGRGSQNRRHPS